MANIRTLYLPCKFKDNKGQGKVGDIMNYYHEKFSKKMGYDTLEEISLAIKKGAIVGSNSGGFHYRNSFVAKRHQDVKLCIYFKEELKYIEAKIIWKEQKEWIRQKQFEQQQWNYDTAGAVSFRYYDYNSYTNETILEVPMNELKGLKLGELLQLIK